MPSPNILFILTDQQRADAIGLANPAIRTPTLDMLGGEGAWFRQSCCNAPVCMPSRHSLFAGVYPSTLGNTCNGIEMPPEAAIFPHYLKAGGYWTANIGKLHFLNHSNRDHSQTHPKYGFDHLEISDEPGCYEDAYIDWVRRKAPDQVDNCRCSSPPICLGPRIEREPRETDEPYRFRGPEHLTHSAFVADRSIQAIQSAPAGKPWFICAGFYAPHCPINPPQRLLDSYDPAGMPDPAWPEEWFASGHRPRGHSLNDWKRIMAAYYALTTHVDDQVRRLLDFLRDQELDRNTLVVFTSDHGEYLGDYGRIQKGPPGNDCIMRVPLIVRLPGQIPSNQCIDAPVELVDLAPTFLDFAGLPIPEHFEGRSLKPLLTGATHWPRKSCYQEFADNHERWQTVRMGPHTYARGPGNQKILWNRACDPRECENRIEHPDEAGILHILRQELADRTPPHPSPSRPKTGAY